MSNELELPAQRFVVFASQLLEPELYPASRKTVVTLRSFQSVAWTACLP